MREKTISRKTLASYAGMLGRRSIAAEALRVYDEQRAYAIPVKAVMTNNGFRIMHGASQVYPEPVVR